ncbi:haloacid dehalogenase superfamily, subfamily IA, variant 3 with third motif having DD or ED/haloacid dehalogenase superfamily, subfamily IA, variant 1 with third motif having Dx(3-4)D or Dx(3-4)E [Arboricoccus pini]|uniref:Haloacid dehalogenase superfamily, subfamily IA, variant 3 with third motif having DD or ED/haloacid dehalogenase superfamily, subfamily IA, variant 1 with third motif having Dx(3-4)D or Dx(3-4)E n=1 Tax=Arboricoccus pini TaxID=1963835 RepID=A0A212R8B8_9PROT|nr:HAD family hydrolase [Arboricoccus pini]SNB68402.1 haloacid dehalogenase superfamily, subfamily IA, variant 3 with third motif having DD or ED/haloacid dehalogenase superfamily, subfamily IA, variant 1 with third motif having Dx(3-4)D or Dx(3-4)E [Arboricoccus pini]
MANDEQGFLFDLDGTLMDSVYQHVVAWSEALQSVGLAIPVWRIHRRIGMSGGLFARALQRESPIPITDELREQLNTLHTAAFERHLVNVRPLPGTRELLQRLTDEDVPWAIATSGRARTAMPMIETIGLDMSKMKIVTRDVVPYAKPNPDLFLEGARQIGLPPEKCFVIGDSIWDILAARRAGSLAVGVLSGGYGENELVQAGAFRVFEDPAHLDRGLFELGVRI